MGFAIELSDAFVSRDRRKICQLVKSIPVTHWTYPAGAAQATYDKVIIFAQGTGGSGINTYELISVNAKWLDETEKAVFLGQYTAEELPLPNYIPKSERTEQKLDPLPVQPRKGDLVNNPNTAKHEDDCDECGGSGEIGVAAYEDGGVNVRGAGRIPCPKCKPTEKLNAG